MWTCWKKGLLVKRQWTTTDADRLLNVNRLRRSIDWFLFYVPRKNSSLTWRRHHYRWRAAKFRPMLGAQGLEQGKIFTVPHLLWHGTSVFRGLIWRTAPFSCLLRHTSECGGPILTRILTGFEIDEIWLINIIDSLPNRWIIINIIIIKIACQILGIVLWRIILIRYWSGKQCMTT
jgi:hypothetical protein